MHERLMVMQVRLVSSPAKSTVSDAFTLTFIYDCA